MKPLTLITSLMMLISAGAFANAPCTDCGINFLNDETHAAAVTLDHLQQESQELSVAPSSGLTAIVLDKLNAIKAAGHSDGEVFDRLQKETEEISIAQPILLLASAIEKKLNKHHVKTQNDLAGSGSK